MAKVKCLYQS